MHTQLLGSVFLASFLCRGVLAAPLEVVPDFSPTKSGFKDIVETHNLERIKVAEADANRQIIKMEHVLKNPDNPRNAALIQAAFGKNAKTDRIQKNVEKLKTGKLPTIMAAYRPKHKLDAIAMVGFDDSVTPGIPKYAYFGDTYHDHRTSAGVRSSTLIHEASHFLANTGDALDKNHRVIKASDNVTKKSGREGYASKLEPAKSVAELNADPNWVKLRDGAPGLPAAKGMHNNAESYAQFGSLCDAVVRNSAVGLPIPDIIARDWDAAAVHLLRRQACAMRKPKAPVKTTTTATAANAAKAKLAATSKLGVKKPVSAAATTAGKKATAKGALPKGVVAKKPLSKTTAKSGLPLKTKSSIASSKLAKSRLLTSKTAALKKTALTGSKTAPRKVVAKSGAKSQAKPPTKLVKKAAGAKAAVRKPVNANAAVRKPVAPVAKPPSTKPAVAKTIPKPVAAVKAGAVKKVRRQIDF